MPNRELVCVGLDLRLWKYAEPLLDKAIQLNRGEFTLEDIYNSIVSKDMQLWGIHDGELKAAMVTEIINYPRKKRLRVVLIGGNEIEGWERITALTLDAFARDKGASGVELFGRRGWIKRLAKYGYKEYETIVVKDWT